MAYLILHWTGGTPPGEHQALEAKIVAARLHKVMSGASWAIFASPSERWCLLPGDLGTIIGDIFDQDGQLVSDWGPLAAGDLGGALARTYWGRYLAVVDTRVGGAPQIFRDPSGGVACLRARSGPYDLSFSDLDVVVSLGLISPEIDWAYLGHHIAHNGARSFRTGIVGVGELLPGQTLRLNEPNSSARLFWRPADVLARFDPITDPGVAAKTVFAAVERTVTALASVEGSLVVELSGGLDSSIIALALRRRPETYAVNCTTPGPEGDERHYARQAAAAARLPLIERTLDPKQIDFRRPPAPDMPRPGRTTVLQSVDAIFGEVGQARRVGAFFNGTGGDSVFGYTQSAAPAADRLLAEGLGAGFARSVLDVAALTGSSAWRAGRAALKLALKRPPPYDPKGHPEYLTPAFLPANADPHPWLEGLDAAPPGRLRHLRGIIGIHGHVDGHDRNQIAPVIAAHSAQPVLEAVLRIPTWLWIARGRDRAVAREAYVALLPADIYNRRSKGRINRFIAEAFEINRPVIGTLLREGELVRRGVIDLAAIERTLAAPLTPADPAFMGVIRVADVELWVQGWLGRLSTGGS